ncbi:MAG TPA: acyl carrier protein [Bacteroidia bacterium]|nr:acyl carrier protein [Bacteroidia bacterium]
MSPEEIKKDIREYLISSIIKNESAKIENNTRLISDGFIDSISTLKIVDHLEKKYGIDFQPHEVDKENLDSIDLIAQFVLSKK